MVLPAELPIFGKEDTRLARRLRLSILLRDPFHMQLITRRLQHSAQIDKKKKTKNITKAISNLALDRTQKKKRNSKMNQPAIDAAIRIANAANNGFYLFITDPWLFNQQASL